MTQIYESPLPLLFLGLILTAGCLFGWLKTADKRLFLGVLLGLLIAAAGVLVERMVVTDRELIERVIHAVAADIRAGRIEAAVQHITPDAEDLRDRARGELRLYQVTAIAIKRPIEITLTPEVAPTKGKAEFNVVVTGGDLTGTITNQQVPRFLIVHFVKKDGRWYASDYEHDEPLRGMRNSPEP